MLMELIGQSEPSGILSLLENMNPDVLGAALILTVIGSFISLIAISVTLIESRKKIVLARLQKETVDDLLSRGYELKDVERIVFGQSGWDKFCGIFNQKPRESKETRNGYRRPVPPQKQAV